MTDAPASRTTRLRILLIPLLAAAVGALVFANSIANDFVLDDKHIVLNNPHIRSLGNWRQIWLGEWWSLMGDRAATPDHGRDRLYRPLTLFTFAVNYALDAPLPDGRPQPRGFHGGNVALHAVACVLVWLLARRLSGDDLIAALAALLFAVHPIHAEAVANVVGRAEVLTTICLIAGLLALLPRGRPPGLLRTGVAALAFFAALLAKESAICYVPVALVALHFCYRKTGLRPRWWLARAAILLLPLVPYFPLRYSALDGHLVRTGRHNALHNPLVDAEVRVITVIHPVPLFTRDFLSIDSGRLIGPFTIAGHYTRLMLAPVALSCNYGVDTIRPPRIELVTGVGLLAALATAAALIGYRRSAPDRVRLFATLATMLLASYALISNTAVLIGVALAERLFYWPSVLVCIALAALAAALWKSLTGLASRHRRGVASLGAIALVAVIGALGARSWTRSADWRSEMRLFSRDARTWPEDALLRAFYAQAILDDALPLPPGHAQRARLVPADRELEQSLRLALRSPYALYTRARVRVLLMDPEAALDMLNVAIQLYPNYAEARLLRENLLRIRQTPDELIRELRGELVRAPNDPVVHLRLGDCLMHAGQHSAALKHLDRARALDPTELEAERLRGETLNALGRSDEAIAALRTVVARDPQNWLAIVNLSAVLAPREPAEALRLAEEACRLRSDEMTVYINRAELLILNGRHSDALAAYREALANMHPQSSDRAWMLQRIGELEALPR